ncbi:sigma 54-interacting transcriptional regulator [Polyangium sp. y55x31]|uniref:sigma 54-interacting transcriptional regulator n=1 Tax=Polyangium sp. y55x31 TaxID=3042688 RepID=UPI0024822234|nr:sigma 54-interacting transcriptional regulator [Polyangium sp. y55x31]MDI1480332.1 sigma 54-interacting transcriptional regulator [Polyangium sp. y55x31]
MAATCFEDAATAVLSAMLGHTQALLSDSEYAASARLVRGVVHLRPEGGYQRLFGIEHPSGARVTGTGHLTSASVWRWVMEHRCSVSIDVQAGTIQPWLPAGPVLRREPTEPDGVPGDATRERMLVRDATHVHVVPLLAPGGEVEGMIALEVSCKAATGLEFVWDEAHESLGLLAGVAAAYLTVLPPRPMRAPTDELLPVVGASTASLIDMLRVFAQQEETILIRGPTGAGKSRLARWCHARSPRNEQPFETVDLLSVPEDLQMAELFGWKRGAFTGAVKDAAGAISRAAGGTLFIDEIDKLSLKAQSGMLRVLEERRFRPLGDESREQRADVRFIVGTNADLRAAMRAGRFREDLYYRINVLPVRLPPLAERLDELPAWAEYMLRRRHGGDDTARLAPGAVELLASTPWPGNLRQLDNIVRRAYALALVDRGAGPLVIEPRHVERALAYEGTAESQSLVREMWRVAQGFVEEAERCAQRGAPLSLDACDAFRGMVLGAAVRRRGGRDEAFALLGQHHLVKNRNHHRALRRELERARELVRAIGGEADQDLLALLDSLEEMDEKT